MYSVWLGNNGVTPGLIVENTSTHEVTFQLSSGSVPAGGNWYYQDLLPGPGTDGAGVMLINTDTNQCLAAGSTEGSQIHTLTCNTYDQDQWWVPSTS